MHYVIVPGINGSDSEHWQTLWQEAWGDSGSRISPASWDEPDLDDWLAALDRAVDAAGSDVVLVAHSLGCLAAAAWLSRSAAVRGAFLVAPPDVHSPDFPTAEAGSFVALKPLPLTVPTLVISSDDDPYCDPENARRLAASWNAGHISVGRHGHINVASGLGVWQFGQALLTAFTAGLGA